MGPRNPKAPDALRGTQAVTDSWLTPLGLTKQVRAAFASA